MSYTFENFRQDLARELVLELPVEERLRGLPAEERLHGLSDAELEYLRQFFTRPTQVLALTVFAP